MGSASRLFMPGEAREISMGERPFSQHTSPARAPHSTWIHIPFLLPSARLVLSLLTAGLLLFSSRARGVRCIAHFIFCFVFARPNAALLPMIDIAPAQVKFASNCRRQIPLAPCTPLYAGSSTVRGGQLPAVRCGSVSGVDPVRLSLVHRLCRAKLYHVVGAQLDF